MSNQNVEIYLDVETDWSRKLTLVGFWSQPTGTVQLIGKQITADRLLEALPAQGQLYTYNGHCFDLPEIAKQLGLKLRAMYDSRDLRFICAKHGLTGGQKAIEKAIGHGRALDGYDGSDAVYLWEQYLRGSSKALATLMEYNREDLTGLTAIRQHLLKLGVA